MVMQDDDDDDHDLHIADDGVNDVLALRKHEDSGDDIDDDDVDDDDIRL